MSDSSDIAIAEVVQLTGAPIGVAKRFLESCNWNVEQAVDALYNTNSIGEESDDDVQGTSTSFMPSALGASPPSNDKASFLAQSKSLGSILSNSGGNIPNSNSSGSGSGSGNGTNYSSGNKKPSPFSSNGPPRIATLSDLSSRNENSNSGSNSRFSSFGDLNRSFNHPREDRDHDLFTGGEKSALAVQPPPRNGSGNTLGGSNNNNSNNDQFGGRQQLIQNILRQAEEGGRSRTSSFFSSGDDDDNDEDDFNNSNSHLNSFAGSGFTLGTSSIESREIQDPNQARNTLPTVNRRLTFWRNGFSVEDGELLSYSDPQNRDILISIQSGHAPLHLLNVDIDQPVNVTVERRLDEDYIRPKKKPGEFEGSGFRLGSTIPGESSSNKNKNTDADANTDGDTDTDTDTNSKSKSKSKSNTNINKDKNKKPSPEGSGDAVVQVKLANGERISHRFDSNAPMSELYDFVNSQSELSSNEYILHTVFPRKTLDDQNISLKDAGVVGSVVVQRKK